MKKLIAGVIVLGGCASPQQQAAQYPTTILCYGTVAGTPQQASLARQELTRRGHECSQSEVEMGERQWAQKRQNDRTNAAAGVLLLQQPPTVSPNVTNCYSTRDPAGNLQTHCR